ncbi:hypothetical protein C8N24_0192 [Solirubrobacter pauli]|uniref:Uncharacterized protein n=2 Tax=Solirubrobacter pauli TaxID=166793 RepID=A0A660L8Y4_9ACTN|nr:hypothetical protein C8N24_0192 [Solirubrobacter pauli]
MIAPSRFGDGTCFVAERPDGIEVLAPPGVRITAARWELDDSDAARGWRLARWTDHEERDAFLDVDPPDSITVLAPEEVVDVLGAAHAADVRRVLLEHLGVADAFGRAPLGQLLRDGHAQAAAFASARAVTAFKDAFPDHDCRSARAPLHYQPVPDTAEALLQAMPGPRHLPKRQRARTMIKEGFVLAARHAADHVQATGVIAWSQRSLRLGGVRLATVDADDYERQ